jgi:hypothetical protein
MADQPFGATPSQRNGRRFGQQDGSNSMGDIEQRHTLLCTDIRGGLNRGLENCLNRRDHDIDYAYTSQITSTATPRFTDVFHPVVTAHNWRWERLPPAQNSIPAPNALLAFLFCWNLRCDAILYQFVGQVTLR